MFPQQRDYAWNEDIQGYEEIDYLSLLSERIAIYTQAIEYAAAERRPEKTKHFVKGLKILESQLQAVERGQRIRKEDIPPAVTFGPSVPAVSRLDDGSQTPATASAPPMLPEVESKTPVLLPEHAGRSQQEDRDGLHPPAPGTAPPMSAQVESKTPVVLPEHAELVTSSQQYEFLNKRIKEYKTAAIAARRRKDMQQALEHMRTVKSMQSLLTTVQQGLPIDLKQVPLSPPPPPPEPVKKNKTADSKRKPEPKSVSEDKASSQSQVPIIIVSSDESLPCGHDEDQSSPLELYDTFSEPSATDSTDETLPSVGHLRLSQVPSVHMVDAKQVPLPQRVEVSGTTPKEHSGQKISTVHTLSCQSQTLPFPDVTGKNQSAPESGQILGQVPDLQRSDKETIPTSGCASDLSMKITNQDVPKKMLDDINTNESQIKSASRSDDNSGAPVPSIMDSWKPPSNNGIGQLQAPLLPDLTYQSLPPKSQSGSWWESTDDLMQLTPPVKQDNEVCFLQPFLNNGVRQMQVPLQPEPVYKSSPSWALSSDYTWLQPQDELSGSHQLQFEDLDDSILTQEQNLSTELMLSIDKRYSFTSMEVLKYGISKMKEEMDGCEFGQPGKLAELMSRCQMLESSLEQQKHKLRNGGRQSLKDYLEGIRLDASILGKTARQLAEDDDLERSQEELLKKEFIDKELAAVYRRYPEL